MGKKTYLIDALVVPCQQIYVDGQIAFRLDLASSILRSHCALILMEATAIDRGPLIGGASPLDRPPDERTNGRTDGRTDGRNGHIYGRLKWTYVICP